MVSPPSPDSANIAIAENKQFEAPLLTRYQNKKQLRREFQKPPRYLSFTPYGLVGPCQFKYIICFPTQTQYKTNTPEHYRDIWEKYFVFLTCRQQSSD